MRRFWVFLTALIIISCSGAVEIHNPIMPLDSDIESYRNDHILTKMTEGKIAVLPFSSSNQTQGGAGAGAQASSGGQKKSVDVIGWKYAEEFSLVLGRLKRFEMVERLQIERIFEEQKIDPSKMDDKTALKIGKLLGAVGIVIGTAAEDYMNVRLVETDTGVHAWNVRAILKKPQHEKAIYRREWAANLVSTLRDATIGIRVVKRPPVLVYSPPVRFELPEYAKQKPADNKPSAAKPPAKPAAKPAAKAAAEAVKIEKPKEEWQEMPGVIIVDFTIDSLAPKSGLQKGDIIEKVEDTPIKDSVDLLNATFDKKPGDKVALFILREEKYYKAMVTMVPINKR